MDVREETKAEVDCIRHTKGGGMQLPTSLELSAMALEQEYNKQCNNVDTETTTRENQ